MAKDKRSRFELGVDDFTKFGRPPIYETPEAMVRKCIEYFEYETNTTGVCKPTISGLMFHLGFNSRQSWYDYAKKSEEFSYAIAKLKQFIESCYEKNLHGFSWAGASFALRNINSADWKDEVIQQQNQTVTNVSPQVVTTTTPLASKEDEIKP